MRNFIKFIVVFSCFFMMTHLLAQNGSKDAVKNSLSYRPLMHFTPIKGWMNDPNGMFYKDGVYHLYFQHNPDSNVWGPMHWGHATSIDLINWKQQPIAIYPDSIGMIFSGSAVVDEKNTSGLGTKNKPAIIAIFTQHNMDGEKLGRTDFQNQSIAYSNDNGYTWKMYKANPVINNPGIKDFRDPKVIWHEATHKWIMILAVKNKVSFYSSSNLKEWTKESDFGASMGSHDGVWECPDLFMLNSNNQIYWVLTSSINPGGPNKGSATQYFIGNFDGHTFTSNSNKTKWMDYGADNYAGVTWSNTGAEKISMGWMSNWMYAQQVPTINWRSAMTLPRNLSIQNINGETYLTSDANKYLNGFPKITKSLTSGYGSLNDNKDNSNAKVYKISFKENNLSPFTISLSNNIGEHIDFGYDSTMNQFFIDRTDAGIHDFNSEFAVKHFAPRIAISKNTSIYALIDKTSIEFFADNGLTVMTDIFFSTYPYSKIKIVSNNKEAIKTSFKFDSFIK